jgi:hypothetical protein
MKNPCEGIVHMYFLIHREKNYFAEVTIMQFYLGTWYPTKNTKIQSKSLPPFSRDHKFVVERGY